MIKPEMKLIKTLEWRHHGILIPGECSNKDVLMIKLFNPEDKKTIKIQTICPICGRSIDLEYGKEN